MSLSQRTLRGRVGQLVATEAGEGGVPVLFVHGNGGNRTQWAAQQAHLKQRSVAFDMRGMGESERDAASRYGCADMAEDVHAVVEALGWERFVLVGHSFGGAVAGTYAARHPERLAGLVFADAGGDMRGSPEEEITLYRKGLQQETYEAFTQQWFDAILRNARPETYRAVMASLRATPRQVFMEAFWGAVAYDPYPALRQYKGPKLSLVTEFLLEPLGDKALHRLVKDLPHRVLSGVSHWLMMDAPEAFNAELDAFLKDIPR